MPPKAAKQEIKEAEEQVFERTEQEEQCERIFKDLDKAFKKASKTSNPDKLHSQIKDITSKLKEAKALIKDFEREARADGMPANELVARKKAMAAELNGFIAMKNQFAQNEGNKGDLLNGAQTEVEMGLEGMGMQQLMTKGRKDIADADKALDRAIRIAEDTKAVGVQVAATLHDQTEIMNKIVDDLNEIEFTMKKASQVIRDITRGLLTDKCIAFLLLLTVIGVVAIIVVKIINPNRKKVQAGASAIVSNVTSALNNTAVGDAVRTGTDAINNAVNATTNTVSGTVGRRMMMHILQHALEINATL